MAVRLYAEVVGSASLTDGSTQVTYRFPALPGNFLSLKFNDPTVGALFSIAQNVGFYIALTGAEMTSVEAAVTITPAYPADTLPVIDNGGTT